MKEALSVAPGPPSHHRVRLGYRIRDAREALGLTQTQVAEKIGRAQNWVYRLEAALMVRIKMSDLNKLLEVLQITGEHAEELKQFARTRYDRTGAWIEQPSLGSGTEDQDREIELAARSIKSLHLEAHDGLIQSEAYMRRQFEVGNQTSIERRVRERLERQRAIFGQESPPQCSFILTEAALRTDMDDPAMMAVQIEHLLGLAKKPYITLIVKPFNARYPASPYDFTVMQFSSHTMQDLVYINRVGSDGTAVIDDDDAVHRYHTRWDAACSASLSEYDSRQKLRELLDMYNTTRSEGH